MVAAYASKKKLDHEDGVAKWRRETSLDSLFYPFRVIEPYVVSLKHSGIRAVTCALSLVESSSFVLSFGNSFAHCPD